VLFEDAPSESVIAEARLCTIAVFDAPELAEASHSYRSSRSSKSWRTTCPLASRSKRVSPDCCKRMLRGVRFVLPAAAQFVEDFCDRALAVVQKRAAVDTRDRLVAQPSLQVVLSLLGGFTELAQRALVATIVVERLGGDKRRSRPRLSCSR
jgi:hypothetical protein